MANQLKSKLSSDLKSYRQILFFVASINIFVNTDFIDPINSPKFWLLVIFGSWLFGQIFSDLKITLINKKSKLVLSVCTLFVLSIFISAIVTDQKQIAFIGDSFRKLGFLTYLFFIVFLLASYRLSNYSNIEYLLKFIVILSSVIGLYGLLQSSGRDFFKWDNKYNSVITTVGNPNFASANLAIFLVINLLLAIQSNVNKYLRYLALFNSLLIIYVINASNSRQGLLSVAVGLLAYAFFSIINRNRKVNLAIIFIYGSILMLSIMGLFNQGPLKNIMYKDSIGVRHFYWEAGLKMFLANPIFGVGVDSFGNYFKQFRSPEYGFIYGYDITSNNAHNIPIQLLATGGIFVFIFYLTIISLVVKYFIGYLNHSTGSVNANLKILFCSWLAFQSQTLISIENIGVSIWGWMFAGLLLGFKENTVKIENIKNNYKTKISSTKGGPKSTLYASIFSLFAIIFCSFLYRAEKATIEMLTLLNSNIDYNQFKNRYDNYDKLKLLDNSYKFRVAVTSESKFQNFNSAPLVIEILNRDKRCEDCNLFLADIKEKQNNFDSAIYYRENVKNLDPWNSLNYLVLIQDYLKINETNRAVFLFQELKKFDNSSDYFKSAQELIEKR